MLQEARCWDAVCRSKMQADSKATFARWGNCVGSTAVQAPSAWPKLVIVDSVSALLSPVVGAAQHNQGVCSTELPVPARVYQCAPAT
jgi:kynureninase